MMLWPRIDGEAGEAVASADAWCGLSSSSSEAKDAPPVDLAASTVGAAAAAPAVGTAVRQVFPAMGARRRMLAAVALLVSAALHAAALSFFLDRMNRPGIEAATEAVSVELVLEEPPQPTVAVSGGTPVEAAEPERPEKVAGVEQLEPAAAPAEVQEAPQEPHVDEESDREVKEQTVETVSAEKAPPEASSPEESAAARPPEPPLATVARREPIDDVTPPPPVEMPRKEIGRAEPLAYAATPEVDAPVPTPRPSRPPAAKTKPKPTEKAANRPAATADKPSKPAADALAKRKAAAEARSGTGAASQGSARGGASAGEKAKYAQKLLSHVQRYKRYPEAAARARITGATRLAITIDRAGRLAGARVAGGSGHPALDEAALAAARRAAPYPRPPEGVGGATFSFAVTMRFER